MLNSDETRTIVEEACRYQFRYGAAQAITIMAGKYSDAEQEAAELVWAWEAWDLAAKFLKGADPTELVIARAAWAPYTTNYGCIFEIITNIDSYLSDSDVHIAVEKAENIASRIQFANDYDYWEEAEDRAICFPGFWDREEGKAILHAFYAADRQYQWALKYLELCASPGAGRARMEGIWDQACKQVADTWTQLVAASRTICKADEHLGGM